MNYKISEKTVAEYRKLTSYHLQKLVNDNPLKLPATPKSIEAYLKRLAPTVCKSTWKKIKRAIIFTQAAYFGERDRSFRLNVTGAHREMLRG